MLETFLNNPILNTIAITLLHFIWQGVLIAIVLKLILLIVSKRNPLLRYSAASLAMVAMLVVPVMTFLWIFQHYSPHFEITKIIPTSINGADLIDGGTPIAQQVWYTNIQQYLPFISLAWFACILGLTVKLLFELAVVNRLPQSHTVPLDKPLEETFERLVHRLNLTVVPRLIISLKAEVPMAIGWLKPVVLLPAHMVTGLSSAQLEMLLLHELAHIKRYDYLVNFLQTLVEISLFFHPAVLWVSKQMRQEREYCSDDIAVAHSGDAIAYAHTLADTASLCKHHRHHTIPSMAMAASGGDLKQRVIRLVDHQCTSTNETGKWLAAATICLSIILVLSKQFLSIPQLSLTVGEMKFFNFYNQSPTVDSSNNTSLVSTNPIGTTIAQQLIASNNTKIPTKPIVISRSVIKPLLDVHAPKLIQEHIVNTKVVEELQKTKISTLNKLDQIDTDSNVRTSTAPISSLSTENRATELALVKSQSSHLSHREIKKNTESLNLVQVETALTFEASLDQLERSAFGQTSNAMSEEKTKENNPYAAQIKELARTPNSRGNNLPEASKIKQEYFTSNALIAPDDDHVSSILTQVPELASVNKTAIKLPVKYDAELIKTTEPRYPSIAKRKGIELDVKVNFTIGTDGKIYDIEFKQQNKVNYFKSAIISAMNKWRFLPAQNNGQPVESQMSKIFSFNLA